MFDAAFWYGDLGCDDFKFFFLNTLHNSHSNTLVSTCTTHLYPALNNHTLHQPVAIHQIPNHRYLSLNFNISVLFLMIDRVIKSIFYGCVNLVSFVKQSRAPSLCHFTECVTVMVVLVLMRLGRRL